MGDRRATLLILAGLTLVAAAARFQNLGALGFYGDEETTAFAARSLAEDGRATMPSGRPYRRALPLSAMNAAAARLLGFDRELPYRIPSALLGTLAVPALFLLARRRFGAAAALLAALALALSEWHLSHAREARMYAAALFFFTWAAFAFWDWAERGRARDAVLAGVVFLAALSFHRGCAMLVAAFAVPLVLPRRPRAPVAALLGAIAVAAALAAVYIEWVTGVRDEWGQAVGTATPARVAPVLAAWGDRIAALLGAAVGVWAARRAAPEGGGLPAWARLGAGAVAGAGAALGQAYLAALGVAVFLLLHPGDRRVSRPALLLAAVLVARVGHTAVFGAGWKAALAFPYPALLWMGPMFPGVFLLFAGTLAYVLLAPPREGDAPLRACALVVLLTTAAAGAALPYTPMRYVIFAYPFVLLVAAAGLWALLRRFASPRIAVVLGALLIASGALGGHGVPQALRVAHLDYGDPLDKLTFAFSFYPDHAAPGRYVRAHRRPGDRLVAEDALEQHWYAGRVDFWLRDAATHGKFLVRDADGVLRDVYVSSAILTDELLAGLPGRLWLVTSGETVGRRELFLSPAQIRWLDDVERDHEPVFTGRDGATKVYLLE